MSESATKQRANASRMQTNAKAMNISAAKMGKQKV
jgi:hypothetical protein